MSKVKIKACKIHSKGSLKKSTNKVKNYSKDYIVIRKSKPGVEIKHLNKRCHTNSKSMQNGTIFHKRDGHILNLGGQSPKPTFDDGEGQK